MSLQRLEKTASAYEARLVPAVFEPWTELMAGAAQIQRGQRVLDVACGTGVLSRRLAAKVGPGGSVTGLDANPGMLAVATRLSPGIEWHRGEAEALPFDDQCFDAVVSQFGLMFFSDREAALQEMLRVLVPGGRLAVAVFDGLEANRAYGLMAGVLERLAGRSVGDALRSPFLLGDQEQLLSLFSAAGIESAGLRREQVTARFAGIEDLVLADVEGWFPLAGISLDRDTIRSVIREAKHELAPFVTSEATVEFPIAAHIVTATRV